MVVVMRLMCALCAVKSTPPHFVVTVMPFCRMFWPTHLWRQNCLLSTMTVTFLVQFLGVPWTFCRG